MVKHNIKIDVAENGCIVTIKWKKDGKTQVKARAFEDGAGFVRSKVWIESVIKQNNEG